MRTIPCLVVAMFTCVPSIAAAQDGTFRLDQYRPSETPTDGFTVSRPDDFGDFRYAASLAIGYANDPLVFENELGDPDSEADEIVEHLLVAHVGGALGIAHRLVAYLDLPLHLLVVGDPGSGVDVESSSFLGDPSAGARVRILGEAGDRFALGAQMTVTFPIASAVTPDEPFGGDGFLTIAPEVLAELRVQKLRVTVNLGALVRETERWQNLEVGPELTYALGVTYGVHERVDALAEIFGATSFGEFFGREESPVEVLLGGRAHLPADLAAGLAIGTGIGRGYGNPDARVVLTVGWAPEAERAQEPPPPPPPPPDADGDGIPDASDACIAEAEDRDGQADADGCPDPDAPPPPPPPVDDDADDDGVLDASDNCRDAAEDRDGFDDADGCPDLDNDGDRVPDASDECPLAPGAAEANGCPRAVRIDVEAGTITILERVEFEEGGDALLPSAEPILEEVRATITVNPTLRRVRVEGHTDNRGNDRENLDLSARRARAVVQWFVAHGMTASRLEAYGCGETRPVGDNARRPGRQQNRRVEFHIVDPAPATGARSPDGCQPIAPE